jgi:hypothetical protein
MRVILLSSILAEIVVVHLVVMLHPRQLKGVRMVKILPREILIVQEEISQKIKLQLS